MTWIVKADDGEAPAEYLHKWKVGPYVELRDVEWTTEQRFAHRFADRNLAAGMAVELGEYAENVRPVKLRSPQATGTEQGAKEKP